MRLTGYALDRVRLRAGRARAQKLEQLALVSNAVYGSIPACITALPALVELHLARALAAPARRLPPLAHLPPPGGWRLATRFNAVSFADLP